MPFKDSLNRTSRIARVIAGKEPFIWWQSILDSMVKDFTAIGVKPKSSVRGRIMGLILEAESRGREQERARIKKILEDQIQTRKDHPFNEVAFNDGVEHCLNFILTHLETKE